MVVVNKQKGETADKLVKRFSRISKDEDIVFYASLKREMKSKKEIKEAKKRLKIQKRKAGYSSHY